MQFKALSVLLLSATAVMANPQPGIIDDITSGLGNVGSDIGGIATDIANIGKSFTAFTAIPTSVLSSLTDASGLRSFGSSLDSALHNQHPPAWFTSLPGDAQSRLSSAAAGLTSAVGSVTSRIGSVTSAIGTNLPSQTGAPTGGSGGAGGAGGSQTSSHNAAPRATALAAGIAGAAGILGLAIAL